MKESGGQVRREKQHIGGEATSRGLLGVAGVGL
jgi:hypothetical protein